MTLALVPARGGSKGVPRKNIRELAGKPLIAWTIEAALAVPAIERVVVSTDDEEIAEVARCCGAQVPFMRPAELAGDEVPGIAPVLHAIENLPAHDSLVLLQPTSPLRTAAHIEALLDFAREKQARSVVSVCEVGDHPAWMYRRDAAGALHPYDTAADVTRRQDLAALHTLNGAMYWITTERLRETGTLISNDTLGFVMDQPSSVDIDTLFDWRVAEMLLADSQHG